MKPRAAGLAAAAALPLLAGCVPLPILAHDTSLRANVSARLPIAVEPGRTTRADLLLALGEPDGAAPDDAWMAWTAARSQGGVLAVFGGRGGGGALAVERVEYRRLRVRFDAAGRVSDSAYEERTCTDAGALTTAQGSDEPCVGWPWVRGAVP
jgi:outer membrane protein assembly factor BamE (lipoprotein component of BamABCDE complex)